MTMQCRSFHIKCRLGIITGSTAGRILDQLMRIIIPVGIFAIVNNLVEGLVCLGILLQIGNIIEQHIVPHIISERNRVLILAQGRCRNGNLITLVGIRNLRSVNPLDMILPDLESRMSAEVGIDLILTVAALSGTCRRTILLLLHIEIQIVPVKYGCRLLDPPVIDLLFGNAVPVGQCSIDRTALIYRCRRCRLLMILHMLDITALDRGATVGDRIIILTEKGLRNRKLDLVLVRFLAWRICLLHAGNISVPGVLELLHHISKTDLGIAAALTACILNINIRIADRKVVLITTILLYIEIHIIFILHHSPLRHGAVRRILHIHAGPLLRISVNRNLRCLHPYCR